MWARIQLQFTILIESFLKFEHLPAAERAAAGYRHYHQRQSARISTIRKTFTRFM